MSMSPSCVVAHVKVAERREKRGSARRHQLAGRHASLMLFISIDIRSERLLSITKVAVDPICPQAVNLQLPPVAGTTAQGTFRVFASCKSTGRRTERSCSRPVGIMSARTYDDAAPQGWLKHAQSAWLRSRRTVQKFMRLFGAKLVFRHDMEVAKAIMAEKKQLE